MKILNRSPYFKEHNTIAVQGEAVRVKPYQIVVWVSVAVPDLSQWDARIPVLPALLDIGNNHNFAIYRSHLARWAGLHPDRLRPLGTVREGGKRFTRHDADIWLHTNLPGNLERRLDRAPYRLALDEGIILYPDEEIGTLHLPLLGLRALTDNRLRTSIDGERCEVTIRTARSRWLWW